MTGKPSRQGPIARIVAANLCDLKKMTKATWTGISNQLAQFGVEVPPLALRRMLEDERNITIDEAAGIANAFGLGLEDIVLPSVTSRKLEQIIRWNLEFS